MGPQGDSANISDESAVRSLKSSLSFPSILLLPDPSNIPNLRAVFSFSLTQRNMAQPDMSLFERANQAASFLNGRLPEGLRTPKVAIVCGSGLGGLADTVPTGFRAEYDYSSIPYFPRPTGESQSI